MAEPLSTERTHKEKHRPYLDRLKWGKKLGKDTNHIIYADVYDIERLEQVITCNIEALFMLLGESNLATRLL